MKKLLQIVMPYRRRLALRSQFIKAAIVGNSAVTGYAMNGFAGAIVMPIVTLAFTHVSKQSYDQIMSLSPPEGAPPIAKASDDELVADILALKERAGIEEDLVLMVDHEDTNMSIARINKKTLALLASADLLEASSRDEILAVIAHEFGHIKHKDDKTAYGLDKASKPTRWFMQYFGALYSVVSLNPVPFLSSVLGAKVHRGLVSSLFRTSEYKADAFSADFVPAQHHHSIFKRLILNRLDIHPRYAIDKHFSSQKGLPNALKRFVQDTKLPPFLIKLHVALDNAFDSRHPPEHKRLDAIKTMAAEDGVDVSHDEIYEPQEVKICTGCYGLENEARLENITNYARALFRNDYGHDGLTVNTYDCGSSQISDMFGEIAIGGPMGGIFIRVPLSEGGEPPTPEQITDMLDQMPSEIQEIMRNAGMPFATDDPNSYRL